VDRQQPNGAARVWRCVQTLVPGHTEGYPFGRPHFSVLPETCGLERPMLARACSIPTSTGCWRPPCSESCPMVDLCPSVRQSGIRPSRRSADSTPISELLTLGASVAGDRAVGQHAAPIRSPARPASTHAGVRILPRTAGVAEVAHDGQISRASVTDAPRADAPAAFTVRHTRDDVSEYP
jgi:hypothetical protein